MVSLYTTAIGYLIGRKPADEVYECLSGHGYLSLRAQEDRGGVISLIERTRLAFPRDPAPGAESWRDVQHALEEARFLSVEGLSEGMRSMTRDGKEVRGRLRRACRGLVHRLRPFARR